MEYLEVFQHQQVVNLSNIPTFLVVVDMLIIQINYNVHRKIFQNVVIYIHIILQK